LYILDSENYVNFLFVGSEVLLDSLLFCGTKALLLDAHKYSNNSSTYCYITIVGLVAMAKRRNHSPCRESNSGCPIRSLVTVLSYPGSITDLTQHYSHY